VKEKHSEGGGGGDWEGFNNLIWIYVADLSGNFAGKPHVDIKRLL